MKEERSSALLHRLAASLRSPASSPYLALVALACTIALSASLTTLNRALVREQAAQQSIFASIFCIEAAGVYALYMIISRMLSFVLSYIEANPHSYDERGGYMASYYYDHIEEYEEEPRPPPASSLFLRRYHDSPLFFSDRPGFNMGHREALISSMYLGGSGAFLALPALCFWDFSVSASFLLSLTLIAFFSDHTKHKEFAPNQDKQRVLSIIQRFRWLLYGTVFTVILGIAFQDSYYYYYYNYYNARPWNQTAPSGTIVAGLGDRPWPMMLLSFSSPLLMRMGTINPRTIAHKIIMSPSQSLEAGLPISTLLAILVLCWYSPLDKALLQTSGELRMQTFVPMLVLCPSCLAAILAFILRGFHTKQTLSTVVPLATTCVIVQQIMDRKMRNHSDWFLLWGTLLMLGCSLLFYLYRLKVLMLAEKRGDKKAALEAQPLAAGDDTDTPLMDTVELGEDEDEVGRLEEGASDFLESCARET
jgi:hypothetical protein